MKVILCVVMSLDGKITRWEDAPAHTWTSEEEGNYFNKIIARHSLLIFGGNTFIQQKSQPQVGKLRIVITRTPEKYTEYTVEGQLEFTSESPEILLIRLEKRGYKEMLLLGGPGLASDFFKKKLVDELWVTLEPRIFGKGRSFIDAVPVDIALHLYQQKRLNSNGTLFLKYTIL